MRTISITALLVMFLIFTASVVMAAGAVTVTSGYPLRSSAGSRILHTWRVTDVDDAETLVTGIGGTIFDHWIHWADATDTQTQGGGHSVLSGGTITFYPSQDSLSASVFVLE